MRWSCPCPLASQPRSSALLASILSSPRSGPRRKRSSARTGGRRFCSGHRPQPEPAGGRNHPASGRSAGQAGSAGDLIRQTYLDITARDPSIVEAFRADLMAVADRDPACTRFIEPLLYFKGFHAIQTHRLASALWKAGRKDFALYLQSRSSEVFQCDIHPAARVGKGIFLDHATGLVVGSTAVIEDDVSILHNVTLGGTGKERGDRHPKIRRGVLLGAGAKIIGNIEVGQCARVAAGRSSWLRSRPAPRSPAFPPMWLARRAAPSRRAPWTRSSQRSPRADCRRGRADGGLLPNAFSGKPPRLEHVSAERTFGQVGNSQTAGVSAPVVWQ